MKKVKSIPWQKLLFIDQIVKKKRNIASCNIRSYIKKFDIKGQKKHFVYKKCMSQEQEYTNKCLILQLSKRS